jgi:5-methylcytosine-specific restriction protein B
MVFPKNIYKQHLLNAIDRIDMEGIPLNAESRYYNVLYKNKTYPPKVIVSYANVYANGTELDRNSFEGGENTPCFNLLKENGFEIIKKYNMSYYNDLIKFLEQAQTEDLGTTRNNYIKSYSDLEVKVSFGQGVQTKVPWISFLAKGQTTSNGIYPVYLYFKSENLLILSYGISETNSPKNSWNLVAPITITNYFKEHSIGVPFKYGDSYVFKVYNYGALPDSKTIDNDLNEIIDIYKTIISNNPKQEPILMANKNEDKPKLGDLLVKSFEEKLNSSGLIFSAQLVHRFIASMCTKPFVICSGLSGSGKTKLVQAFAQWISNDESQYLIAPVGADWTNREPLLGYPNALTNETYVIPENGVLELILRAKENFDNVDEPTKPYFLILDEMNLSHVERYFADFLSAMESGDKIPLHKIQHIDCEVPSSFNLPKNLFIVGTVNIDETTYMFSPKVLDRANTIEFRLSNKNLEDFIQSDIKLNLNLLKGHGTSMSERFMELALMETNKNLSAVENDLKLFFSELKKSGAEFGYRTASEIGRLMYMLGQYGENGNDLLDIAIMQKLLPKLHGSRNKLTKVLPVLGSFCLKNTENIKEDYLDKYVDNKISEKDIEKDSNVKYRISFEKICRMYKNAIENGFASYAEA